MIFMNTEERHDILLKFFSGLMSLQQACEKLKVHRTTLWRLRRKWEQEGAAALAHGLRGRRSNGAKADTFRKHVCDLFASAYKPLGHTAHSFYEKVARDLPDYVCYKTVFAWLREAGLTDSLSS